MVTPLEPSTLIESPGVFSMAMSSMTKLLPVANTPWAPLAWLSKRSTVPLSLSMPVPRITTLSTLTLNSPVKS